MARVHAGSKRLTPKEQRLLEARQEAERAAQDTPPARRGEPDADPPAPEPTTPHVPTQAEPVLETNPTQVVLGSEKRTSLTYTPPPADADDGELVAHARRGIIEANRALTAQLGMLERDYVLSAGLYLWHATERERYKAAGFPTMAAFAASVELTKQDVYRLRRAVPIYQIIGDMVESPLNERTIRELHKTLTNEKGKLEVTEERANLLRRQFAEMKSKGRVTSAGAIAARNLLAIGSASPEQPERPSSLPPATRVARALEAPRLALVDVETLAEAARSDPSLVRRYVDALREAYETATQVVEA